MAIELQLEEGTTVVSRHQRRYIDQTLWSLQTSFYPKSLVDRGAQKLMEASDITEGTVAYLRETVGIRQAGDRDKITVRVPDPNETAAFKLPSDGRVAVFEILRTAFSEDDKPFRLTSSVFPADRNQFVLNVGRPPAKINALDRAPGLDGIRSRGS